MYICHYIEGNYEKHKKQKIDELQEAIGRIVSHENYHGIRALVKQHS